VHLGMHGIQGAHVKQARGPEPLLVGRHHHMPTRMVEAGYGFQPRRAVAATRPLI